MLFWVTTVIAQTTGRLRTGVQLTLQWSLYDQRQARYLLLYVQAHCLQQCSFLGEAYC